MSEYVPDSFDRPALREEQNDLDQVANNDKGDERPQAVCEASLRFINNSHDEDANGDFGQTERADDKNLCKETPLCHFRYILKS